MSWKRAPWALCALCAGLLVLLMPRAGFASEGGKPAPDEQASAAEGVADEEAAPEVGPEEALPAELGKGAGGDEEPSQAPVRHVLVHIVGDADLELQMFDRKADEWRTVCRAPCDRELPASETYRIDAPGVRLSHAFRLDEVPGDRLVLDVDTASSALHAVGVTALVVGATPVALAAVGTVAGAGAIAVSSSSAVPSSPHWAVISGSARDTCSGQEGERSCASSRTRWYSGCWAAGSPSGSRESCSPTATR